MTATQAPRWTRLDYDERRAQIFSCARRLFSERHYSAVSTAEIAREAGVARGLLHHYFGTKRELYLEVVRYMVRVPPHPVPEEIAGRDVDEVLAEAVDLWLEMVERNRGTWVAAIGAEGLGRDPEVEAILEEARDEAARRVVALVHPRDDGAPPRELHALIRAYAGLAEAASLEWLERGRLTREQVRALLVDILPHLVHHALPDVRRARGTSTTKRARRSTR